MERDPTGNGIQVWIEPPAEQVEQVVQAQEEYKEFGRVMFLMNWVCGTELDNAVNGAITVAQAVEFAKRMQDLPQPKEMMEATSFGLQMAGAAIVGTAWVAARFGSDALLDEQGEWITRTIVAGCRTIAFAELDGWLVDDAVLGTHPLLYGARGAAALIARSRAGADVLASARLVASGRLTEPSAALLAGLNWKVQTRKAWELAVIAFDRCVHRSPRSWRPNPRREMARVQRANTRLQKSSLRVWRLPWASPSLPRLPKPVARWQIYRIRNQNWPLKIGLVRSDWVFEWTRAGKLLAVVDMDAVVADPVLDKQLKNYLRKLVDWLRDYMSTGRKRFDNHFPYQWADALATAVGRYAAQSGEPNFWRKLTEIQGGDHAQQMVSDYLEAVTKELINSRRAPDDRFWNAWRGAANWLLEQHGLDNERVEEWATAAGLMGPYTTPLPEDWPHLDAVLPEIDRWAEMACGNASAALRLIKFAARLDVAQRGRWLLRWAGLIVARRRGDRDFWGYGGIGDTLAALLEPLAATSAEARKEVRRLISVVADAGSLGAREALARLAGQRDIN